MALAVDIAGIDSAGYIGPSAGPYAWPAGAASGAHKGALAELSEIYRQMGFEAGYSQATRDQLESHVVIAESVLREHGPNLKGSIDARQFLYRFIARLESRLNLLSSAADATPQTTDHFVNDGLGI